jgi:sterol desaturase/sphingolipid hydroxylase (fatty acid hydroxylase superfamily)
MLSPSSIQNFAKVNILLVFLGLCQQVILSYSSHVLIVFFIFVSRNYVLLHLIEYGTRNKPQLQNGDLPKETYKYEFHVNVFTSTAVEAATYVFIDMYYMPITTSSILDIVYFIPVSFAFEICFDFCHYIAHRSLHHPSLYKYFHIKHHTFRHPIAITTFYQDPADLIVANSVPTMIALQCVPCMTPLQFHWILVYKNFIEISGHCGKDLHTTSSFTQCMWLAKWLQIELYTVDHDLHHSLNKCNYGKRFSLWDKCFGTYKHPLMQ